MKLLDAHLQLSSLKQSFLNTSDAAACLKISPAHASKILGRLAQTGLWIPLARNRWAQAEQTDPLLIPEFLTAPFPTYISLQTALYYHGMISQIPSVIYAVSLARTHTYTTPLGTISIHHISPDFFFGFDSFGKSQIKMATPEKALLDIFYLSPTYTSLFKALPELEIPPKFKTKDAWNMVKSIPSHRLKTIVSEKLKNVL